MQTRTVEIESQKKLSFLSVTSTQLDDSCDITNNETVHVVTIIDFR